MSANAEAWFKDTDKEVEILKTQTKETYYQNADGKVGEMDISSIIEKIDKTIKVYFGNKVNAITPGQAAVFYEKDDIIGGGWIHSSFKQHELINHE